VTLNQLKKTQIPNARQIALRILCELETKDAFANETLELFCKNHRLSNLDRRFVSELVNGTTKMRRRLDYILSFFLEKEINKLTPWIRNILRLGVYQIDFMDRVPDSAAVNEAVNLAKKFGHRGTVALVNAVLRSYLRDKSRVYFPSWEGDKVENIALFYSFPNWMVESWLNMFGEEETIKLCQAFNEKPKLCCRMNSMKVDHISLEEKLTKSKIKFKSSRFLENFYHIESRVDLNRFLPLQEGLVYLQDESAGFPVLLLAPQPGEIILDLCAAPGGKTTFIAELLKGKGKVLSVDKSWEKIELLRENCRRLSIDSVNFFCADACDFQRRPVDRILVDAPCSGLGVLGKNSDSRWRKQKEDLVRLQKLQLQILFNAANLVKKGGVLVYSTCTITPEENDQVIANFLGERGDFKLVDASLHVDSGVVDQSGFVRTLPHIHKMDGTFAARLEAS
jgi:16S rRNA (cytosine967-C5)-methyltransferase